MSKYAVLDDGDNVIAVVDVVDASHWLDFDFGARARSTVVLAQDQVVACGSHHIGDGNFVAPKE